MSKQVQLSDHFNFSKLFRFTLPSIIMMIFTSVYGVVDGLFVSNFVGKTEFAAVNFIMPFIMILGTFGFMFGTGGSALVSKIMGEGDRERANKIFSLILYTSVGFGAVIAILGVILTRPVAMLLGAEGQMLEECVKYGRIVLIAIPAYMLQYEFQSFMIAAEKPKLGLATTLAAGFSNMILDALLVAVIPMGVVGAAIATALSACVGGIIPLIYFLRKNTSLLRLGKAEFDGKALLKTCTNGSSELMSNISMSLVSMLYNFQLMKYAGEDGVAAYGVMMYINMIFLAVFIGYSVGIAPVVSFHYGASNHSELRNLRRKSLAVISISSVLMALTSIFLASPLSHIFVGYDEVLLNMTVRGLIIYSFSFLFSGIAIFGSCFFTALNDGLTSAIVSFLRTLVFQIAALMLLPLLFELDGIWISIVVAELMAAVVTVIFLVGKRKRYKY